MTEAELYRELGGLTRDRGRWEESIGHVASLLDHVSVKIRAKALWLLGEMGLAFPDAIGNSVSRIAQFLDSGEPLLRERAANALGRIGRGRFSTVKPYWESMFGLAKDETAGVRLAFIWASENIATSTPTPYEGHVAVFAELLHDSDERVRMEAPEMFRVLGKRRPELVEPYLGQLRKMAETDSNRVVRIHCQGAISAIMTGRQEETADDV